MTCYATKLSLTAACALVLAAAPALAQTVRGYDSPNDWHTHSAIGTQANGHDTMRGSNEPNLSTTRPGYEGREPGSNSRGNGYGWNGNRAGENEGWNRNRVGGNEGWNHNRFERRENHGQWQNHAEGRFDRNEHGWNRDQYEGREMGNPGGWHGQRSVNRYGYGNPQNGWSHTGRQYGEDHMNRTGSGYQDRER